MQVSLIYSTKIVKIFMRKKEREREREGQRDRQKSR